MCKVLIMPGIKAEHREKTIKFIREMGKEMSSGNSDGLGYAAVDKDGSLFGQRWLVNRDAFGGAATKSKLKPFEKALRGSINDVESEKNSFGDPSFKNIVAITLHTRLATSPKNMQNVHPFVYQEMDTSLIHNGIIRNDTDFKKSVSTCDSEAILTSYLQEGVNLNPEAMKAVGKSLNGYYACGVFSRNANKERILDVFKGNNPSLYLQEIKELETYVFATSDDDVKRVCDRLGLTKGDSFTVLEGHLMRINPLTGELVLMQDFHAPAISYGTSSYSSSDTTDRGSTPSHSNVRSIRNWKHGDSNTDGEDTELGNVIDATTGGGMASAASSSRKVQGGMSKAMLEFMELKPKIRELNRQEVTEEGRTYKFWSNGKRA